MLPTKGTSTKRIVYKEANFLNDSNTLQHTLNKALEVLNRVGQRQESLDQENTTYRLINSYRNQLGMLFGNLFVYSKGVNQHLITLDEEADEFNVSQMAPPAQKEFLDSVLHFGIKDNHVLLAQSMALKSRDFESYLGWILQDQTKTLDADNRVVLIDQPPKAIKNKISKNEVKCISFATPLLSTEKLKPSKEGQKNKFSFSPSGKGADILKALLGKGWFEEHKLKEALDGSNLEVSLDIYYKGRTSTGGGLKLLENLAVSMRHQDEDDVIIYLKRGGQIRGNEIKIFSPVSVRTIGGLVDQTDLFPKMHKWLAQQIEAGLIDP